MSLSIDGTWKTGVWATTVWADGVWFEGAYVPTVTEIEHYSGGYEDYSRHPYLRSVREKEKFIKKQDALEEQIAHIEVDAIFKYDRQPKAVAKIEARLELLREELDGIKVLNALLAEEEQKRITEMEEEESIFMMMCMIEQ